MKTADIEVTYLGSYGTDLEVVNAARVSFHKQANTMSGQDGKLISYLAKHKHHSPFNHAFLSFRVKAPIFVARQLVKHKFMPWNEVSRRYVDDEPEFYFPEYWRARAANVKQGSSEERIDIDEAWLKLEMGDVVRKYEQALAVGVCPEQARMVLPQNTMTEWVWSGTLGAFLDMLVLRLDSHTQKETRDVAEKIAVFVKNIFPVSYAAYIKEPHES
ncbi:THY1 Predicted alternative thymidylate synthase [uncultured Caudovirales phage]|uniref:THY1 Predicted alternative thymidylate synthase n=1 Tax=uncultured Caudovirales phage TaxID=2100421 RepID=A0A6J5LXI6_9CAUD|nr:THY1 Predicted alternative thymidylate synthase [uncultured Caudovirales phage]